MAVLQQQFSVTVRRSGWYFVIGLLLGIGWVASTDFSAVSAQQAECGDGQCQPPSETNQTCPSDCPFEYPFVQPSAAPPEGNMPVTVWNRRSSMGRQVEAAIDIDGGGPAEEDKPVGIAVGSDSLDLGTSVGGQNLYFGFVPYDRMNPADFLMLLQTSNAGTHTDRLTVTRDGDLLAGGDLTTAGCFGPTFQGFTSAAYTGQVPANGPISGYLAANLICDVAFPDTQSHVCSTAEILNSIKCARADSPIRRPAYNDFQAWIQDGPPGYTAAANDCRGWQSAIGAYFGRIWRFSSATGGQGFVTTCNQTAAFACCGNFVLPSSGPT